MKILIMSYSNTGNNEKLAEDLANNLKAENIKVIPKNNSMKSVITKHIFQIKPKCEQPLEIMDTYDLVIFCAPVWMGQIAAPIRGYIEHIKDSKQEYAFVSISGGSTELNANPNITSELIKRAGREPKLVYEYHIANILQPDPKPVIKDIMAYRINDEDVEKASCEIIKKLNVNI